MIEMKCCDILGTRILVTNMADTVEQVFRTIQTFSSVCK